MSNYCDTFADMNWVYGEVCSGSFNDTVAASSRGLDPKMGLDSPISTYDKHGGEHGNGGGHGHGGGHGNGDKETPGTTTTTTTTSATTTNTDPTTTPAEERLVPVTKVVALTLASAAFILLVMSTVLCCVVKSHKKNLKSVANHQVTM